MRFSGARRQRRACPRAHQFARNIPGIGFNTADTVDLNTADTVDLLPPVEARAAVALPPADVTNTRSWGRTAPHLRDQTRLKRGGTEEKVAQVTNGNGVP